MMGRRGFFLFVLASAVVAFIAVNTIASSLGREARLDLTANNLYALSAGSAEVLDGLDEPIDGVFYYSRRLAQDYPALRAYGARVDEMLRSFEARARGRLRIERADPEPFSEAEDRARAEGVEPIPAAGGEALFFGLVLRNAVDERVVIPSFNPEREAFLEYELARATAELEQPSQPKVGLITGLSMETAGAGGAPLYVFQQLLSNFELVTLDRDFSTLPDDLDVLMIAHPWPLDDAQLYAIDQFAINDGRILAFLDPYSRLAVGSGPTLYDDVEAARYSDLGPLLEAWGVSFDPDLVVLDSELGLEASFEEGGRMVTRPYPLWIGARPEVLDSRDLAAAPLNRGLNLGVAGRFVDLPGGGMSVTTLIRSGRSVRRLDALNAAGDPKPGEVEADARPLDGPVALAVRISGPIASAFPDGAPEFGEAEIGEPVIGEPGAPAAEPNDAAHREVGRAEILLVADSDLLDDMFYVQSDPLFGVETLADNDVFVLNAIDLLAGSRALVALRARAKSERPMTRVDAMRSAATERYYAEQARLESELKSAEEKLAEFEAEGRGSALFAGDRNAELTRAERDALERIRTQILDARAGLRDVQRSYRADIDRLEAVLVAINVWLAPLLVAAVGVGVAAWRRRAAARRRAG